jgi:hypothetical protein
LAENRRIPGWIILLLAFLLVAGLAVIIVLGPHRG